MDLCKEPWGLLRACGVPRPSINYLLDPKYPLVSWDHIPLFEGRRRVLVEFKFMAKGSIKGFGCGFWGFRILGLRAPLRALGLRVWGLGF